MIAQLASLHPFLVHFAVALTIASAAFDAADFFLQKKILAQTGFILMLCALPFLLLAVFTGNLAEAFARAPEIARTLRQHETYANMAAWSFCAGGIWRIFLVLKKQYSGHRRVVYVFVVTLAAASVFLAAEKGGSIRHHGYEKIHITTQSAQRFFHKTFVISVAHSDNEYLIEDGFRCRT